MKAPSKQDWKIVKLHIVRGVDDSVSEMDSNEFFSIHYALV
jgi:hypothetical protein